MNQTRSLSKTTWISILIIVVVVWLALYFAAIFYTAAAPSATVYLVRHAEKLDASANPGLSSLGLQRAEALRHALSEANIDAIYVSQFLRTAQTAAPLANFLGLDPIEYQAGDASALAEQIRTNNAEQNVLVVGHSNTVDDIARALGSDSLNELAETQYDRLFVLHLTPPLAMLERLRYGAESP